MPAVHRDRDKRICGHVTEVTGQDSVFANGKLVAVDRDGNNGGGGALVAGCNEVYINGKLVVNNTPDSALPDGSCPSAPHCTPATDGGSDNVFAGD